MQRGAPKAHGVCHKIELPNGYFRPSFLPDPALVSCGIFLPAATPCSYSTPRPSAAAPAPRESVACSTPTDTLPARSVRPPGCFSGTAELTLPLALAAIGLRQSRPWHVQLHRARAQR